MESVIVIRSLVPGGAAQLDGRLVPGDRLVFVNNVRVDNASLDEAVQALKGAPRGRVMLGVAKPLPLPDVGTTTDHFVIVSIRAEFSFSSKNSLRRLLFPLSSPHRCKKRFFMFFVTFFTF